MLSTHALYCQAVTDTGNSLGHMAPGGRRMESLPPPSVSCRRCLFARVSGILHQIKSLFSVSQPPGGTNLGLCHQGVLVPLELPSLNALLDAQRELIRDEDDPAEGAGLRSRIDT